MNPILLQTSFLSSISSEIIIAVASSLFSLIGGYVWMRERILKNEMKLESVYDYIDNRNQNIEAKIKDLQQDIQEFKEINRETSKSLEENTAAIRELKVVLNLVTEKLQKI